MLNENILNEIGINNKWLAPLNNAFQKHNIIDTKEAAMFLAQTTHESNDYKRLEESFRYTPQRLFDVFKKRVGSLDNAKKLCLQGAEAIANFVYGGRLGNGQDEGYKYRGRGIIQLTGKNNYQMFAETLKLSLDETINYCTTKNGAIESALFYWMRNDINKICDKDDIKAMTKAINGGFNGLEDRATKYMQYKKILSNNNIL